MFQIHLYIKSFFVKCVFVITNFCLTSYHFAFTFNFTYILLQSSNKSWLVIFSNQMNRRLIWSSLVVHMKYTLELRPSVMPYLY
jgi:hypothetical protein